MLQNELTYLAVLSSVSSPTPASMSTRQTDTSSSIATRIASTVVYTYGEEERRENQIIISFLFLNERTQTVLKKF